MANPAPGKALAFEGLTYVDVLPGAPEQAQADACRIHLALFGHGYAHATADITRLWQEGSRQPDIHEHQWLLSYRGEPCGEFAFQVNLRRGIVSRLFLGLLPEFRTRLAGDWITAVLDACAAVAAAEASDAGRPILAMMSEVKPRHVRGWRHLGHVAPAIGYREPLHGNHWREFGPLEYQPMAANFLLLEEGRTAGMPAVAAAGVQAFLLDYYAVPADDSVLAEILGACSRLDEAESAT